MAAPDPNTTSPISQLLNTLGLTREDLQQRSDEMRQFLTADSAKSSRVSSRGRANSSSSSINLRSMSSSNSAVASSARSLSRASSISQRDASPSPAPVKSEPIESDLPPRQYDNMEMVIERQRQARKEKKQRREKGRDLSSRASVSHRSPTPGSASSHGLLDSRLQRRDDDSVDAKEDVFAMGGSSAESQGSPLPLTPQQAKYYREHTASQSRTIVPKSESPVATAIPQQQAGVIFPLPAYISQAQLLAHLQNATNGASFNPVTPQTNRVLPPSRGLTKSPLPPSSPPAITPQSSPMRPVVNLVSSPGPMGPAPNEESYSKLPYKLPPGPYSPNKPDLSYAALLGQAILSSADHRLTLQEIYDWITIVYPYFKRGETTWMNSIRHVLSTTACFRKVTRDRTLGRTQWAIWDEDMECFKNGGFRKQFCKDMNGGKIASEVQRGKRGRKQNDEDGSDRKAKKAKKDKQQFTSPASSHPIFPPRSTGPQIQSYVDSAASAEVMFPPLPPDSGLRQLTVDIKKPARVSSVPQVDGEDAVLEPSSPASDGVFQPPSSASTSSVPELTPNCSSSSPPPSTSDLELDAPFNIIHSTDKGKEKEVFQSFVNISSDEEEPEPEGDLFAGTKLTPVQFWGVSPKRRDLSKPGVKLKFNELPETNLMDSEDEQDQPLLNAVKNKNARQKKAKLDDPFDRLPASPTRKAKSKTSTSKTKVNGPARLSTPPPITANEGPSTPSRNRRLELSPVRTPLSHRGLHMSPSASLAHYKSHLDPPPAAPHDAENPIGEFLYTPSRGRTLGFSAAPVTPKRSSAFPLLEESPFRFGISPFRTPGSRGILDPHDPRALLDEELNRLGETQESPATGLFGKRQLLYDSPNATMGGSPGKWRGWW
ncbi:hypothetical protein VKT23_005140 [Stygiomarasmius scandens]|uniref:Fork-head domain-containing protein n=1 Tax=Marasmiellus scandens TaxID=2682957 RepID=A0ABR1JS98_9AGAR